MKHYKAPWSTSLIVISSAGGLLCSALSLGMLSSGRAHATWLAVLLIALLFASALFTVRGYSVRPDAILVHRLFWTTRLPRAGLQSAQVAPNAMRRSIRLLGNGGLFSFTGWFRNKAFGTYRAFVTDPQRAVVLHFRRRTVIVSPSAPEEFVHQLRVSSEALQARS